MEDSDIVIFMKCFLKSDMYYFNKNKWVRIIISLYMYYYG